MESKKEYREGDQDRTEKEEGVRDTFCDSVTGEPVGAITTLLLVQTANRVEVLTNINGIKTERPATLYDIVSMTAAAGAFAQAKMASQETAKAVMESLQQFSMALRSQQGGSAGVPVIGHPNRFRPQ